MFLGMGSETRLLTSMEKKLTVKVLASSNNIACMHLITHWNQNTRPQMHSVNAILQATLRERLFLTITAASNFFKVLKNSANSCDGHPRNVTNLISHTTLHHELEVKADHHSQPCGRMSFPANQSMMLLVQDSSNVNVNRSTQQVLTTIDLWIAKQCNTLHFQAPSKADVSTKNNNCRPISIQNNHPNNATMIWNGNDILTFASLHKHHSGEWGSTQQSSSWHLGIQSPAWIQSSGFTSFDEWQISVFFLHPLSIGDGESQKILVVFVCIHLPDFAGFDEQHVFVLFWMEASNWMLPFANHHSLQQANIFQMNLKKSELSIICKVVPCVDKWITKRATKSHRTYLQNCFITQKWMALCSLVCPLD